MRVTAEIRAEMAKQRITIKDLSEQIGMPRTTLSARLNDHSHFDIGEFDRVSAALGIEPWELMRRANGVPA